MNKITIVLADDHHLFRFGIRQILEKVESIQVIGEADSIEAAYTLTKELQPDLILLDIKFPHKNGVDLALRISHNLNTKVLILTRCVTLNDFNDCFNAGANGFLVKNTSPFELVKAIRVIAGGGTYFSKKNILPPKIESSKEVKDHSFHLEKFSITAREFEVLKLVSEEKSNKEIGDELFISHRTVETHKRNLMQKLKVKNVVGLVKFYLQISNFEYSKLPN